jgi:hypothetical protein
MCLAFTRYFGCSSVIFVPFSAAHQPAFVPKRPVKSMLPMLTSEHDLEMAMVSVTRSFRTYDVKRPSFVGLRLRLSGLLHGLRRAARPRANACWPDDLNDHYLQDAGMKCGLRHEIADAALLQLRIGPRGF